MKYKVNSSQAREYAMKEPKWANRDQRFTKAESKKYETILNDIAIEYNWTASQEAMLYTMLKTGTYIDYSPEEFEKELRTYRRNT